MNAFALIYLFRLILPLFRLLGMAVGAVFLGLFFVVSKILALMGTKASKAGQLSSIFAMAALVVAVLGWPLFFLIGLGRVDLIAIAALTGWWLVAIWMFPGITAWTDKKVMAPALKALRVPQLVRRFSKA